MKMWWALDTFVFDAIPRASLYNFDVDRIETGGVTDSNGRKAIGSEKRRGSNGAKSRSRHDRFWRMNAQNILLAHHYSQVW